MICNWQMECDQHVLTFQVVEYKPVLLGTCHVYFHKHTIYTPDMWQSKTFTFIYRLHMEESCHLASQWQVIKYLTWVALTKTSSLPEYLFSQCTYEYSFQLEYQLPSLEQSKLSKLIADGKIRYFTAVLTITCLQTMIWPLIHSQQQESHDHVWI